MIKKIIIGVVVAIFIIIGIVAAQGESSSPSSPVPEDSGLSEIALVQDSMTAVAADTIHAWEYKSGQLEGGVAVLVNNSGAYWVKDNVVYAANGSAKTWSPNLNYSPTGIDFSTVQAAVTAQ